MIRQATIEDCTWMAEKSLPEFSKIYSRDECPTLHKLISHFISKVSMAFVTECKSAFIIISHIFHDNMIVQKIDFWFSSIAGHGILLWNFICDMAKNHRMPQFGIFHNIESSLLKFVVRKGFEIKSHTPGFKMATKVNV